jgi:hypothetical protein
VVTAPSGKGFVVIPGGTPGQTVSSKQPALPGPQNDAADFYGLGAALALIVAAIFFVRKIVPLRRQVYVGRHPTQPPGAEFAADPDPGENRTVDRNREDAEP